MNLIQFLKSVFNTDMKSIQRCLAKATIIAYDGNCVLIANSKTIYYFGVFGGKLTKASRLFYVQHKATMVGKLLYATAATLKTYHRRVEILSKTNDTYKCIWKG